jgi:hypothetical protein
MSVLRNFLKSGKARTGRRTGGVAKLRNQVLKLKLKKAKIKAQRELNREQMRF